MINFLNYELNSIQKKNIQGGTITNTTSHPKDKDTPSKGSGVGGTIDLQNQQRDKKGS